MFNQSIVRDYLPLQQGLRPYALVHAYRDIDGQRLSSITTRIKTYSNTKSWRLHWCQRLSSITTRIKTTPAPPRSSSGCRVRDYLPLQQGLRPKGNLSFRRDEGCQRLSSITTRIKTNSIISTCASAIVCQRLSSITTRIKTSFTIILAKSSSGQRLSSITTRIKTFRKTVCNRFCSRSETIFHYNKD